MEEHKAYHRRNDTLVPLSVMVGCFTILIAITTLGNMLLSAQKDLEQRLTKLETKMELLYNRYQSQDTSPRK